MASHKDLYWNLLSSTCRTSTIDPVYADDISALPTKHGSLKISMLYYSHIYNTTIDLVSRL